MCNYWPPLPADRVRPYLELADVTTAEYSMWYSIWLRTREWHHQSFMAWLVTLIGAKARESNEAWEAKHVCDMTDEPYCRTHGCGPSDQCYLAGCPHCHEDNEFLKAKLSGAHSP